ncbi:MAG: hypothetical protein H6797_03460 [Candidatus Nomurabacteria bacterium]|nr:MAG: hypothetical protein H6797_03460 [Candidatus Nomurabacteria bacterium]
MLKQNQKGISLVKLVLIFVAIVLTGMAGFFVYDRLNHHSGGSIDLSAEQVSSLPDISYFKDHKSDQFIVDMNLVQTGFPFKGKRSAAPHTGAHTQFGDDYKRWPQGGASPNNYPPVYSPVDGYVFNVKSHFSDYSKNPVDLYGLQIAFAKSDGKAWSILYSLEPFVKEPSPGFYAKFIDVKEGQKVHKGQVIAHMYLSKDSGGGQNEHIHFQLNKDGDGQTYAPAIFTKSVVDSFHDHWGSFGVDEIHNDPHGPRFPACMGYKLSAAENPFGTGAVDCLN